MTTSLELGLESVAVVLGGFLSGAMMNLYLLGIPLILETNSDASQLLHQWHFIFQSGHTKGPTISIVTATIYSLAALTKAQSKKPWAIFAIAAATTVSMIPFTWIFMGGVNNALFRAVDNRAILQKEDMQRVTTLVTQWSKWNAVRALFPLSGAVVGLLGAVGAIRL